MQTPRAAVLPVVCVVALLSGCRSSRPSSAPTATASQTAPRTASGTLNVSPVRPSTRSTITFSFIAPVRSGVHGSDEITYSLIITGAQTAGCIGAHEATPGRSATGRESTLTVAPTQLGGAWCPGRYSARVIELQRPHCAAHAPCPQFIREVAIVARASFEIQRA